MLSLTIPAANHITPALVLFCLDYHVEGLDYHVEGL